MHLRPPSRAVLLALVVAALGAPAGAEAQERTCDLIQSGRVDQREVDGVTFLEFFDPFYFRCTDGTELRANSGTLDQASRQLHLRGSVFFEDPFRTLTAAEATYDSGIGRLHATGDVVFVNRQEGSTLRGPELEYFRPTDRRPEPQVHARQRPHLTLQPREASADTEPLEVDADEVTIIGEDQLHASGSVVITRTDLVATSDRATYSGATGDLMLRGNADIASDEYDLGGEIVEARMVDGVMDHVHAREDASLRGEELNVTAPDLQLFFADELLQRAVARTGPAAAGGARPIATSRTFRLEADSIDALVPAQQVELVTAIGSARGESIDTTAVDDAAIAADAEQPTAPPIARGDTASAAAPGSRALVENDWIRGDTIIGYFSHATGTPPDTTAQADTAASPDTAALPELAVLGDTIAPDAPDAPEIVGGLTGLPGDTAAAERSREAVLERLVARGSALALYRMPRDDAPPGAPPRVNFLSGQSIELTFADGELEVAEVDGLQRGIFLDPVPAPTQRAQPDPTNEGG